MVYDIWVETDVKLKQIENAYLLITLDDIEFGELTGQEKLRGHCTRQMTDLSLRCS